MLNVIENGMRIQTPWYAVFPPRATEKLQESAASNAISQNDQVRESNLPHPQLGKKSYQEVEHINEERHKAFTAKDIMSGRVVTLPSDADLLMAWSEFKKYGIRHMPVVDAENKLEGIISDRDILREWANMATTNRTAMDSLNVGSVMTVRVLTGNLDTSIREIADAMTVRHIGAVPLLDEHQRVAGIVTRSDILRAIVHQAPIDLWS